MSADGGIFTGANIENASYGMTICAERTAVFKAVLAGHRKFKAIAIVGSGTGYTHPCGACLQVLAEFSTDTKIVTTNENDDFREYYLGELLPQIFSLNKDDFPEAVDEQIAELNKEDPSRRGK